MALTLGACGSLQDQAQLSDRECMARVMYFESNRSSEEGMLAVGTVVMNRVQSPKYPKSICGVVGQTNQFAEGALSKPVHEGRSYAKAEKVADDVLEGARHDGVGDAMFFHTAGYSFPYRNMRYVTLAGGNIFYQKRNPEPGLAWPSSTAFAQAHKAGKATMLASADRPARDEEEPARAPVALASARPAPEPSRASPTAGRPVQLASAAPVRPLPVQPAAKAAPIVLASARTADKVGPRPVLASKPGPATKAAPVILAKAGSVQGLNPSASAGPKKSPIVVASLATRAAPPEPKSISIPAPQKPSKATTVVALAEKPKAAHALSSAKAKPMVVAMLGDKSIKPPTRPRGRVVADDDD